KGYSGDGGDPLDAKFSGPKGIAIDAHGNLLVVDTENHAVRRIDFANEIVTTVLGGKHSESTVKLRRPHGIAAIAPSDQATFLVADSEQHRVVWGR
ncbi:MAG: hypothetical protein HKN47_13405, partial [Pirellulaceae bacterium]|nr:hypothetical protein [Pirellulaceae bacterium]